VLIAVVQRITNVPTAASRVPTRVYLLSAETARGFGLPEAVRGLMAPRLDGYFSAVTLSSHATETRQVLLHEYAHFLIRKGRELDYPTWYDEGFAEVLGTVRRRDDLVTVGGAPIHRLWPLVRARSFDLEAIFAPRGYGEVRNLDLFYAGAWATVHYLNYDAEQHDRLARFVDLLVRGTPWREAYARVFPMPLDELSRRVHEHAAALARGVPIHLADLDARGLAIDESWELRPVPPPRVAIELAELALALEGGVGGGPAIARELFARALALDPQDARALAGQAVCRAEAGDLEAARTDADRAVAAQPDDPRVQRLAGRAHAVRAERAADEQDLAGAESARLASRAAFVRAEELAPDDPAALAGFGASFVGAVGDVQPGIAALERALDLGAWDPVPVLDLGRLYLAAGDLPSARARLEQVARLGEGDLAEAAKRLLAELDQPIERR
jgi:FimV-like protein